MREEATCGEIGVMHGCCLRWVPPAGRGGGGRPNGAGGAGTSACCPPLVICRLQTTRQATPNTQAQGLSSQLGSTGVRTWGRLQGPVPMLARPGTFVTTPR